MEQQAFSAISDKLWEELAKQGFSEATPYEDEKGRAVMFTTDEVAYSLCYITEKKSFALQSTTLDEEKKPGEWRQLALWLFDPATDGKGEIESIAGDFVEIVQGPKRIEAVQTARKKKKKGDEENNIDPLFFFNRVANILPEFRETMNEERIVFGQIRYATVAKNVLAPKIQALGKEKPDSEEFKKIKTLINDMYQDGDGDLRSILTAGILNNIPDTQVIELISQDFGQDLAKVYKCSRKLIGKKIKPEKVKKRKKVVAAALENGNRLQK